MSVSESPTGDVTIRSVNAPVPSFSGMTPTLPSALRQLRRHNGVTPATTAHPSEMTALANRLGGIHLDKSPNSDSSTPSTKPSVQPTKLEFAEYDDASSKENIIFDSENKRPNDSSVLIFSPEVKKMPLQTKSDNQFTATEVHNISSQNVSLKQVTPLKPSTDSKPQTPVSNSTQRSPPSAAIIEQSQQSKADGTETNEFQSASVREDVEHNSSFDPQSNAKLEQKEEPTDVNEGKEPHTSAVSEATVKTLTEHQTAQPSTACERTEQVDKPESVIEGKNPNLPADIGVDPMDEVLGVKPPALSTRSLIDDEPGAFLITPTDESEVDKSEVKDIDQSDSIPSSNDQGGDISLSVEKAADVVRLRQELDKIKDGNQKWTWPERCEALKYTSDVFQNNIEDEGTRKVLNESLPTISSSLKSHLTEVRPAIVTSALNLFDSVMKSPLSSPRVAEDVFPSVVNVASSSSPAAREAVKSAAAVLNTYPSLENVLEESEGLERLCEISKEVSVELEDDKEMAESAKNFLDKVAKAHANSPRNQTSEFKETGNGDISNGNPTSSSATRPIVQSTSVTTPMSQKLNRLSASQSTTSRTDVRSSVERIRSYRRSRMSWRSKLETPYLTGKKSDDEALTGTTQFDKSSSSTDGSQSARAADQNGRMYTEKEVSEIRKTAIDAVIENLSFSHKEEMERLNINHQDSQRLLEKERAENAELKSVLDEYISTMSKMIAEANTQANNRERQLQADNNKLKAEVVEIRDSFDQLKVRYDKAKQTVDVMAKKETRLIEQVSELKRNMVELQTWSNELKANTEKKLNKAFDQVTAFRTSFLEQEAHAKKALSDLVKAQAELEKESASHKVTAKRVSQLEYDLHNEQDARVELSGDLATSKTNLARLNTEREDMLMKFESAQVELVELREKVADLEPRATRANEFKEQLDEMRSERQQLKARAFDDITNIRRLEDKVRSKENEIEELSAICEEVMSQLEASKLSQGAEEGEVQ